MVMSDDCGARAVPRLFVSGPLAVGATIELPAAETHHALHALRLVIGDAVTLFDGRGGEYGGVLAQAGKRTASVTVDAHHAVEREAPLRITLAQGLSSGDRMDYTVQKAVELGVTALQPIAAARSVVHLSAERAAKRLLHWQQIALHACEQCGRNRVPAVAPVQRLTTWLASLPRLSGEARLLLQPEAPRTLRDVALPTSAMLAVGPEGGFDADECRALAVAGFVAVRLGPRVLRTETAGAAALAAMLAHWGDF